MVLDLHPARLDAAKALGAEMVVNVEREDPVVGAEKFSDGQGFDKVIEAVGGDQDDTLQLACWIARRGGVITVIGTFSRDRVTLPAHDFKWKELEILGLAELLWGLSGVPRPARGREGTVGQDDQPRPAAGGDSAGDRNDRRTRAERGQDRAQAVGLRTED